MTNETNQEQVSAITAESLFERCCEVHREVNLLTEQLKEDLDAGKEKGLDAAMINSIAKAYVKDKVGEMQDKATDLIDMIDTLVN